VGRLQQRSSGDLASRPQRRPRPASCEAPISDEQIGILTHELVEGTNPGYRIAYVLRITGALQSGALRHAAEIVAERHDCLRSAFPASSGEVVRRVYGRIALDFEDLPAGTAATEVERLDAITTAVRNTVLVEFNTAVPPLWRVRVLSFAPSDHAVVWVVHHAIADGWSMSLLMDEFATCLTAGPGHLPEPVDYGVHVAEQRRRGRFLEPRDAAHSATHVGHDLVLPDLEADRHAGPTEGDAVEQRLDAETATMLRKAVRSLRATPNTILLASWNALLARYAQSSSVSIAMIFADRQTRIVEGVFGPCHATVPVLFHVDENNSFAQHVETTRTAVEEARNKALSSGMPRGGPSARTSFSVHQGARQRRIAGQLTFEYGDEPIPGSVGDADVFAYSESDSWRLLLTFRRRAMGRRDAHDVLRHFAALLHGALRRPDDALASLALDDTIPDLSVVEAWQVGARPGDIGRSFIARLAARAEQDPDAVALTYGTQNICRGELIQRAHALTTALCAAGAAAGDRIGILAPRSPAMAVAQIAIRQLGASFVPLDPTGPDERLAVIVKDAGLHLLVEACVGDHPTSAGRVRTDMYGCLRLEPRTGNGASGYLRKLPSYDPDAEAYVLFTSGSTGRPKGVSCSERALLRVIGNAGGWVIGPDDIVLMCAPTTFDISLFEMWNGLLAAQRLVILDPASHSVEGLAKLIVEQRITSTMLVPRLFHDLLARCPGVFTGVRQVFVGGDVNSASDFSRCRAEYQSLQLFAVYGPTETGVVVASYPASGFNTSAESVVPIGSALAGSRLAVADMKGRPLPAGIPGELLVGGDAVELAYVGRSVTTDDRFRPDPLDKRRQIYATGDVVKMRRDGVLEFLGRRDRQFKLGAYRIEPAEIEAAALTSGCLDTCVVAVRPLKNGERDLIAALVPKPCVPTEDLIAHVRRAISQRLPSYMIPAHFCIVPRIPTSAHGKTDLSALFRMMAERVPNRREPASSSSELVVNLAAAVLGDVDVSGATNFFAAGGHSLAAIDLCGRLSAALGREIPMSVAFEAAALDDIAASVDRLLTDSGWRVPLPAIRRRRGAVPASFSQRRLLLASRGTTGAPSPVVPLPFRLFDPVHPEGVQAALDEIVKRHPVLATNFYRDKQHRLRATALGKKPILKVIDLAQTPPEARYGFMGDYCKQLMATAHDLETESPMRCVLFLCPPEGGVLLLVLDHVAYDGRSLALLTRDLTACYAGGARKVRRTQAGRLSFLDYAAWEAERDRDGTIDRLAEAAAARLAQRGRPLWPAKERLEARTPHEVVVTMAEIDGGTRDFRGIAQRFGVTTFVAVLAVVVAALMRAKPNPHLRIALQTSTRIDRRLFDAVGPFMNTTYLDVPAGRPIGDLARVIQQKLLAAHDDALVPIDRLLSALAARGQPAEIALSDVFFSLYQDDHEPDDEVARRIVPIDPLDGWDTESFHAANAVAMLSTLDRKKLSVRFGVHPAIRDRALGGRFADALATQFSQLIAP
jgi:amino acid adenylation domain-containing protein